MAPASSAVYASGFLIDRFSPQRIQTFVLLLSAIGVLILAFAGTSPVALVGAAILGVGLGSEADVAPYLLAHYFGPTALLGSLRLDLDSLRDRWRNRPHGNRALVRSGWLL